MYAKNPVPGSKIDYKQYLSLNALRTILVLLVSITLSNAFFDYLKSFLVERLTDHFFETARVYSWVSVLSDSSLRMSSRNSSLVLSEASLHCLKRKLLKNYIRVYFEFSTDMAFALSLPQLINLESYFPETYPKTKPVREKYWIDLVAVAVLKTFFLQSLLCLIREVLDSSVGFLYIQANRKICVLTILLGCFLAGLDVRTIVFALIYNVLFEPVFYVNLRSLLDLNVYFDKAARAVFGDYFKVPLCHNHRFNLLMDSTFTNSTENQVDHFLISM